MERRFEIDLIKVLALILMPMSHVFDEFGNYYSLMTNIPEYSTTQLGLLFMNIPALFLLCLGFGIIFSKNSTPEKLFKRGVQMFIFEGILNVFRIILPRIAVSYCTGDSEFIKESFEIFFMSDILPFAGFTFFFFALVKKLNLSVLQVLFIGLLLTLGQILIPQPVIPNVYLRYLVGYFIYVDQSSFFPIISWLIYPIVGYCLADNFVKKNNVVKFYTILGLFGLLLFLTTNIYLLLSNSIQSRYYLFMETGFRMDLFTTLIVLSSSLILLSLVYFISRLFIFLWLKSVISSIAQNVNSVYCIHWVLVEFFWAIAEILGLMIEYDSIFTIGFLIFLLSSSIAQLRKMFKIFCF